MNVLLRKCSLSTLVSQPSKSTFLRCLAQMSSKVNFDELVKDKPIVVFMKGTPKAPRCGFSNAVCQILEFHGIKSFDSYDVLSNEDIRQGVKEYTNWPTIPQVFFNGEFLGGCDIMLEMHKSGELIEELKKIGIRSALLDKA
ncbi:glutaredoxin-related protein 5, mitochondrial-like [Elysia marginata]|uniref:Glutaredoxin-related protein 5, mitochondrial n=1 Tax=Elysia marginata TaxID=1093978 RepID=A0AAV4G349_9GAST|nr:glutaredoxin-related protein 5, mitochondrial-like [Elysia marginata]